MGGVVFGALVALILIFLAVIYLDDPAVGQVVASNLTSGKGGVASGYTDQGRARAIRHGIRADGTPLLFMPSAEFYFLSDEDLRAVGVDLQSLPPLDYVKC